MVTAKETPAPSELEIVVAAEVAKLDRDSAEAANQLVATMGAQFFALRKLRSITVTDVADTAGMKAARAARLEVRAMRIEVENTRKQLKESSLRRGQAIDKVAGIIKGELEPIEAHLLAQETYAERMEAERVERVGGERYKELARLQFNAPVSLKDLADMDEAGFAKLKSDAETLAEARAAKAKKEADERAERERIEADKLRAAQEETARVKAQAEAERAEARKREEAARIEREKLERELSAKRAEEERASREEAARIAAEESSARAAAAAPDAEKIRAAANTVRALNLGEMTSEAGVAFALQFASQREKFAVWLESTANKMTEGSAK